MTRAYEQFIAEADLNGHIGMELGHKPLDATRREELWDAAFDTQQRGDGSEGHAFGTSLSAADKDALIEHLKTL